ncbi:MAG: stage V sporulation protein B [Firmicutes bacterium]|nr:stage V sporulation protein B [Bacillota bacterium]
MTRQSFVYGAAVLLVAGLLNRILGFAYQIMMIRLIKPEGIGLFNMIYPIYVLVLVMATAGIPVAVSKLVAEEMARDNLRGAYRIFHICFLILVISSTTFTVVCFLASPLLLEYVFPNPKVYFSFLSLMPGLVIVSLCSAFRGFFQGLQQMTPTAVTQFLEQLVRVVTGLFIAYLLMPYGVEYAAIGASIGVVIGEFTGFMSILVIYAKGRPVIPHGLDRGAFEPLNHSLGRIFNLAIPVTLTRFVSTSLMSIDAVMIPGRLQSAGLDLNEATAAFGQFVGISESLLFTPGIITISLATALIPAVSDALASHNLTLVRTRAREAIRITLLAGIPSSFIFFLLAEDLCSVIFGYPEAGASLRILAVGGPFLYIQQTTTGILLGLGEASRPFRNLVFASVFKMIGIYYLTALPHLGIRGTAMALVVGYAIMARLNLADIRQLTGFRINQKDDLLKPFFSACCMTPSIVLAKHYLNVLNFSKPASTAGAVFSGLVTYFLFLLITGCIDNHDLKRLKRIFFRNRF